MPKNYNEINKELFSKIMSFGNFFSHFPRNQDFLEYWSKTCQEKKIKETPMEKISRSYWETIRDFSDTPLIKEMVKSGLNELEGLVLFYFICEKYDMENSYTFNFFEKYLEYNENFKLYDFYKSITDPKMPLFKNGFLDNGGHSLFRSKFEISPKTQKLLGLMGGLPEKKNEKINLPNFKIDFNEFKEYLLKNIKGQDEAVLKFSLAIYKHTLRCVLNETLPKDKKVKKANIMIMGPTGSGKTHMCRLAANYLKVPFIKVNATQYTETGYVGMSVEEMLERLYKSCDYKTQEAKNGIIFIDEIDKIAFADPGGGHNSNRDVSGLSVQEELLKLLEDDSCEFEEHNRLGKIKKTFNIENVLFICAGAFYGMDEIRKQNKKKNLGFRSENREDEKDRLAEELKDYGFIPEFIGRFGSFIEINRLSQKDLKDILLNCEFGPYYSFSKILAASGCDYKISEKEAEELAKKAYLSGSGARALFRLLEEKADEIIIKNMNSPKKIPLQN